MAIYNLEEIVFVTNAIRPINSTSEASGNDIEVTDLGKPISNKQIKGSLIPLGNVRDSNNSTLNQETRKHRITLHPVDLNYSFTPIESTPIKSTISFLEVQYENENIQGLRRINFSEIKKLEVIKYSNIRKAGDLFVCDIETEVITSTNVKIKWNKEDVSCIWVTILDEFTGNHINQSINFIINGKPNIQRIVWK